MFLESYCISHFQLLSQESSEQKDFVDTPQISDLNVRGADSRISDPVVLSIKTDDSAVKKDAFKFSLFNGDNNLSELQVPIKNSKVSVSTVSSKEVGSARLNQRSEKVSRIKKTEDEGNPVRKSEPGSEIYEVNNCFKCEMCNR